MRKKTKIVITPGEPAGIGIDITIKLLQKNIPAQVIVISDYALLEDRAKQIDIPIIIKEHDHEVFKEHSPGTIEVLPINLKSKVEIDENTLKKIAQKTGGYYFRATDADSLAEIYTQIDKLERTEITEIHYLQNRQSYSPFVIIAMAMIATSGLLSGTIFRNLP